LLKQLYTRIYFADEPSNQSDPILALVPEDRRNTLMAHRTESNIWNFEIRLCSDCETVFFDV
jgi:protocatechuate 3,4-dioxygenase alpha subunit